jgi:hypothetical protein
MRLVIALSEAPSIWSELPSAGLYSSPWASLNRSPVILGILVERGSKIEGAIENARNFYKMKPRLIIVISTVHHAAQKVRDNTHCFGIPSVMSTLYTCEYSQITILRHGMILTYFEDMPHINWQNLGQSVFLMMGVSQADISRSKTCHNQRRAHDEQRVLEQIPSSREDGVY